MSDAAFAGRQAARRAGGRIGAAAIFDRLDAIDPYLRAYAEWIEAADGPDLSANPIAAAAEIRDAIGALYMLNARRELDRLGDLLADEPTSELAPAWRSRVADLSAFVRELERSGRVRSRPWPAILARERSTPPRDVRGGRS